MSDRVKRRRSVLAILAVVAFLPLNLASVAWSQVSAGDVVITELFEELYRVNPATGFATDLLNSPITQELLGQHIEVADAETAYFTAFDDLYRFNLTADVATFITQLSFAPQEITLDAGGDLIAVEASEIFRIDVSTGQESSVYTETFFGPSDAVVDSSGNIYLTEFFDALGVLAPGGGFSPIGNFQDNMFSHLDLGPDGMLYLSTTFGGSLYRVDPVTGVGTELDGDVFTFIDDLQVDALGHVLFAGEVDSRSGLFRFNPATNQLTTIVDNSTQNGGFFDPSDVALFAGQAFAGADLDKDGDVDDEDLSELLDAYGSGPGGDTDGDGDTDGADFLAWQRQFDGNLGNISAAIVPEPSSVVLLIGCLACRFRRRPNAC